MTTPQTPSSSDGAPDPLEARVTALTDWRDSDPTIYAEALRRARAKSGVSARPRSDVLSRVRRPHMIIPAAVAAMLVLAAAAQWFSGASSSHRNASSVAAPALRDRREADAGPAEQALQEKGLKATADQAAVNPSLLERSVVRKTSIEIQSTDVRAGFARAGLLVNEALGEFIESSSLTGEGATSQGALTLRVRADRVSDVLNALRELGTVATEKSGGDDVTDQVVDLAARLRNERKVEEELLKLLETRKGAPLKEILDLREQLAKVRERIEQMTAQQEQFGRAVSLATILVILRPQAGAPIDAEQSKHESALDYFGRQLALAWHAGTRALADSTAGIVRALVGGLVWWAMLAFAVGHAVRLTRTARRRARGQVAPAL